MGFLFPPPDQPLRSGLDDLQELTRTGTTVGVFVAMTAQALCPLSTPVADPPYESHAPISQRVQAISVNSTTLNARVFDTIWARRSESDPFAARKVIHLGA